MMSGRVQFYLNRAPERIEAPSATRTLLDYLRYEKGLTGTKEGCAEGDCGACTVVLGEAGGYRAVNSCILFLPALDGKEVITVEGLRQPDGRLHPVQQALVDTHGSQCGFCTPGIVMSLFAHYLGGGSCDSATLSTVLAGNLCRCTGYGPILAAGAAMHSYAAPVQAVPLPPLKRDDMLATGGFLAPRTIAELCGLLAEHPDATLLAGGTDVGLWVTKQHKELPTVIYLGRVEALNRIEETERALIIGAGVRYADALPRLAALWPAFGTLIERLGAVQVRSVGTIGGNIANGSPIGDSLPVLIALGAEITLRGSDGRRRLPVESYFLGYQKQDRRPGEFVEQIIIPRPGPDEFFRCYKISKRIDQDISAVCGAFNLHRAGGVVQEARIAFGGMAATPKRAPSCEAALHGRPWTLETVRAAAAVLDQDFAPISDFRASADYRLRVARNLLVKAFLEDAP